jgi:Arc/MetJ-type ribon-helix-helix transcriptional regulator
MPSYDFPTDVQTFLQQEVASGKFPNETDAVVAAVRQYRDSDAAPGPTEGTAEDASDTLNWDDLIPEPPTRPSGRVRVRLKTAGRDRPLPAEDPWVK